jgi:hypothetical protein
MGKIRKAVVCTGGPSDLLRFELINNADTLRLADPPHDDPTKTTTYRLRTVCIRGKNFEYFCPADWSDKELLEFVIGRRGDKPLTQGSHTKAE